MLAVLGLVSIGLFALVIAAPGDPVTSMLSPEELGNSQDYIAQRRHELGLDRPLPLQYVAWAGRVLQGDLGTSFVNQNRPVAQLLLERLGPTLELMLTAMTFSILLALVLGVTAAARKNKPADYLISTSTMLVMSVPAFFLGMLAIYVFAFRLRWLPSSGMSSPTDGGLVDLLKHLVLPAGILAIHGCAGLIRYVRAGLLEELNADYVRTAVAKGAGPMRARMHALRNSLLPLITLLMMNVPELLGGAVILETLFAWPGMGQLTLAAIGNQDIPLIVGFGLIVTVLVLLSNLLADLLYRLADPRVRLR